MSWDLTLIIGLKRGSHINVWCDEYHVAYSCEHGDIIQSKSSNNKMTI